MRWPSWPAPSALVAPPSIAIWDARSPNPLRQSYDPQPWSSQPSTAAAGRCPRADEALAPALTLTATLGVLALTFGLVDVQLPPRRDGPSTRPPLACNSVLRTRLRNSGPASGSTTPAAGWARAVVVYALGIEDEASVQVHSTQEAEADRLVVVVGRAVDEIVHEREDAKARSPIATPAPSSSSAPISLTCSWGAAGLGGARTYPLGSSALLIDGASPRP